MQEPAELVRAFALPQRSFLSVILIKKNDLNNNDMVKLEKGTVLISETTMAYEQAFLQYILFSLFHVLCMCFLVYCCSTDRIPFPIKM